MLHELLYPLAEHSTIFNLLRYITFRSIAGFVTAFFIGLFVAPWFIKKLQKLKFGQSIRNDGPKSHKVKAGTPTMGGVFIILATLISIILWTKFNYYVMVVSLSLVLFGGIGFMDDYLKIKAKNTKGVQAKLKLLLQAISALILILLLNFNPQNWQDNSYLLKIKNNKNLPIKTYALSSEKTTSIVWTMHDDKGKILPQEKYTLFLVAKDVFGIETEFVMTNIKPNISNNILISLAKKKQEIKKKYKRGSILFNWTINEQNDFEQNSSETIAEGIVIAPAKSNMLFDFYLPYYSKPIFVWPAILGILFFMLTIVGFSNATNLSDGLDGLAAGMGIILFIPFGIFAYVMGNAKVSSYLLFPFMNGAGEISVIISAMIGGYTAFLWHNVHPAKIFMGDTGSLAMGGTIATIAIILKQEVLLVVAGSMFVLETVSVILQVFWFKRFKKRIFKMAPIHHHFELSGWAETQVVPRFWILAALAALLALAALKIR